MPVNAKDLPANIRKQLGVTAGRSTPRRRSEAPAVGGPGYVCQCGDTFPGWNPAERHSQKAGHTRLSMILEVA